MTASDADDAGWPTTIEHLPDRVLAALLVGDKAAALLAAESFRDEWFALEERLLALGVGYLSFLSDALPPGTLSAASAWMNPELAGQLEAVSLLPDDDRRAGLHDVLGGIEGHDVTAPVTRPDSPHSCRRQVLLLLDLIRTGDAVGAQRACVLLKREWMDCQDRMVHLCAALSTYVADSFGEQTMDQLHFAVSVGAADAIDTLIDPLALGTPALGHQVLSLLRAHSMSGTVSMAGASLEVELDCSSGLRMWRRGVDRFGVTRTDEPWSLGERGIPYYCSRCTTGVMRFPAASGRLPLWTIQPPRTPQDTCLWRVPIASAPAITRPEAGTRRPGDGAS